MTGESMGRYRLLRVLGEGGMGTVHLARGRRGLVALKVLAERVSGVSERARFRDEIRVASRLAHPNVARVLDAGSSRGELFCVFELVHGVTLRELAREGLGPLAAWIVAEACEGLHAAHELADAEGRSLGVVHRDVSPSNVMVGFDGAVKVIDFGVARALGNEHRTATGELRGKLAYMAPEMIDGLPVDRRADVWSLGVVLWECLAGLRLFARRSPLEVMEAVRAEPIPPIDGAPLALEEVIAKALARDPSARFATARAMADALRRALEEEGHALGRAELVRRLDARFPPHARPPLPVIDATRAPARRWLAWLALALVAAATALWLTR